MGTIKFTKTVLENLDAEAKVDIETKLGRTLVLDEVIDTSDFGEEYGALCNGEQCKEGEVCVFGNCVKDDTPETGVEG